MVQKDEHSASTSSNVYSAERAIPARSIVQLADDVASVMRGSYEEYDASDVRGKGGKPIPPNTYGIRDSAEKLNDWPVYVSLQEALRPIFDWIAQRVSGQKSMTRHALIDHLR